MAEGHVRATARVTLTVEVAADGAWGTGTAIEQVQRQAAESAVAKLQQALRVGGGRVLDSKVVAVLVMEDR